MNNDPFVGIRFERTQPREWRSIPFDTEQPKKRWLKIIGYALLWMAIAYVALWSISQSAQVQVERTSRSAKSRT